MILHHRGERWTTVPNEVLDDPRLSFKAKGVLAFLVSKPEGWEIRSNHLATIGPDGRDAVRSGLRELVDAGYLAYEKAQDDHGHWSTHSYLDPTGRAADHLRPPETGFPASVEPGPDNPKTGDPTTGEPGPLVMTQEQELITPPNPPEGGDGFAEFWEAYPRRRTSEAGPLRRAGSRKTAHRAWAKLTAEERRDAVAALDALRAEVEPAMIPHASTYLNQARWEAFLEEVEEDDMSADVIPLRPGRQACEFCGGSNVVCDEEGLAYVCDHKTNPLPGATSSGVDLAHGHDQGIGADHRGAPGEDGEGPAAGQA